MAGSTLRLGEIVESESAKESQFLMKTVKRSECRDTYIICSDKPIPGFELTLLGLLERFEESPFTKRSLLLESRDLVFQL